MKLSRNRELTQRETEIFELLEKGMTSQQISKHLGIAYSTTKNHVFKIMAKLGVTSRYHLLNDEAGND